MRVGDCIPMSYIRAEGPNGWDGYNAPDGERFVVLLLGTTKKDGSEPFRSEAALNRLGWFFCDNGSDPKGENSRSEVEGEASQSGAARQSPEPSNPSPHKEEKHG